MDMHGLLQDLESKDANEILVRSSPKEMSSLRGKMGGMLANGALDKKPNPDTMVTKYCQFPPEVTLFFFTIIRL